VKIIGLAGLRLFRLVRFGRATFAMLDPIMDKVFVATVAVSMIVSRHLSFGSVALSVRASSSNCRSSHG
jgi:phosphatidylglycerophosphate synthase